MTYLLDTDTLNYLVKGVPSVAARFRASNEHGATFVLASFVHYEITRYHNLRATPRIASAYKTLIADWRRVDVTGSDWDTAASLWAGRHAVGQPIEDSDLLIALCALKSNAVLVTNNTRHFADLGVVVENWADDDK